MAVEQMGFSLNAAALPYFNWNEILKSSECCILPTVSLPVVFPNPSSSSIHGRFPFNLQYPRVANSNSRFMSLYIHIMIKNLQYQILHIIIQSFRTESVRSLSPPSASSQIVGIKWPLWGSVQVMAV